MNAMMGFQGLRSSDLKPVLKEDGPRPGDPRQQGKDAVRAPRMKLPPLPSMSARAMASVASLRGYDDGKSGYRYGSRSARGVAGEASSEVLKSSSPAGAEDVDGPSCQALREEVQELLRQVQSMSERLSDSEQACGEKAKVSQELQKALEHEFAQAEVERLEVRHARQRLETFRTVLSKASRRRPGAEGGARSKSTSPDPPRRLRLEDEDDELLAQLSLAGAEGANRLLLAELAKAKDNESELDSETLSYQQTALDGDLSLDELRSRLAARRAENADLRRKVSKSIAHAVASNGSDSAAGGNVTSPTSTLLAEDVQEVTAAVAEDNIFSLQRDVVLEIIV